MTTSSIDQPPPKPNDGPDIWRLVIADMEERRRIGIARYGTPLQPFNGRDALIDAFAEALDLAVYLKQALVERETLAAQLFRDLDGDGNFANWLAACDEVLLHGFATENERLRDAIDTLQQSMPTSQFREHVAALTKLGEAA